MTVYKEFDSSSLAVIVTKSVVAVQGEDFFRLHLNHISDYSSILNEESSSSTKSLLYKMLVDKDKTLILAN